MSERKEVTISDFPSGNAAPLKFYLSDENGHALHVNPALLEFLGADSQDMLGAGWVNSIYDEDRQAVLEHFVAATCTRQPYTLRYRLCDDKHAVTWIQDLGLPRRNSSGVFSGYVGLIFDLPEHEQRTTVCHLGERAHAVILHRYDGTITYWGEAATALYGWTPGEALGRTLDNLLGTQASSNMADTREALCEKSEWCGWLTHQTKSGQTMPVQVRSTFLSEDQTTPLGARDLVTVVTPQ